jgi:hypothetical protein
MLVERRPFIKAVEVNANVVSSRVFVVYNFGKLLVHVRWVTSQGVPSALLCWLHISGLRNSI